MNAARASRRRRSTILVGFATLALLVFWATRRVASATAAVHGHGARYGVAFALAFVVLFWQSILANLERPHTVTRLEQGALDQLNVAVLVPLYNEDRAMLAACLSSIIHSSRVPKTIVVVDDGSKLGYNDLQASARMQAADAGITLNWRRTANHGKRHAQGVGVGLSPDADIYVTVDSDGVLDRDAIAEIVRPFADRRVKSVAGIVLALNNRQNLLTRMTDLWFVCGQLIDRSSMSTMGAVLVNSGVLAAYDGPMIRRNLDSYLNETFFGRAVEFSDDSMLTMYALAEGRAVQQSSAFAFTLMPETLNHHLRQYLRWMRGATIRTWWRFRYLPLRSYAYWAHLFSWFQLALASVIFVSLFVVDPISNGGFTLELLLIPVLIGYGQALRYLTFRRDDESVMSQVMTVALSPFATVWAFVVLRGVRWYGMVTCLKTGWGTRQEVEIGLT